MTSLLLFSLLELYKRYMSNPSPTFVSPAPSQPTPAPLSSKHVKVNFLQLNCHRSSPPACLLDSKLCRSKLCTIALVQEPHLNSRASPVRMSGYSAFHPQFTGSSDKSCRAGIVANDNQLDLLFCPRFSDRDTCTVLTTINATPTYIVSVYLDIKNLALPAAFEALLHHTDSHPTHILVGMDSNCHSTLWGSPASNSRGDWLEDVIFAHDLTICNTGSTPTFGGGGGAHLTHIDISLCSSALRPHISKWHVDNSPSASDHHLIRFSCHQMGKRPSQPGTSPNPKLIDWDSFSTTMHNSCTGTTDKMSSELLSPDLIERWTSKLYEDISASLTSARNTPPANRLSAGHRKRTVVWWSPEIATLQLTCKQAWKTYRKQFRRSEPTMFEAYELYCIARRVMKQAIQKAKRSAWKQFVSTVQDPISMAKLCRSIFNTPSRPVGLLRNSSGTYTNSAQEVSSVLFDKFFPQSSDTLLEPPWIPAVYEIPETVINLTATQQAFASFSKNKAAGPDNLKPYVLQALPDSALVRINHLYTGCLRIGYIPKIWRQARVILLHKSGRPDLSDVKSFRPISLTCFLFKGLERLLYWDLLQNYLPSAPLSPHQHAFRKGRSTDTALSSACDYIESKILQGQYAMGLFLDIAGAFDNVLPARALTCMQEHNFPDYVIHTYNFYLLNRQATITVGQYSATRSLTRGVPQGGILSPLIWNLIFDHLLITCNSGPVKAIGYADDALLITSGIDPSTLVQTLQHSLNAATTWGDENGLTLSPSKTIGMLFHRSPRLAAKLPSRQLMLKQQPVSMESQVRYLGLILSPSLSWHAHIADRTKKAKRKLHMLKAAIGVKWGPSPHLVRWAHRSIVIPTLTYGNYIWGSTPLALKQRNQMSTLNRLALTSLAPMRLRTPTAGLEIIFHQPPIPLAIRTLGMATHLRLADFHSNRQWSGIGHGRSIGHISAWTRIYTSLHIPLPQLNVCPTFHCNKQLTIRQVPSSRLDASWWVRMILSPGPDSDNRVLGFFDIRSSDSTLLALQHLKIPGCQGDSSAGHTGFSVAFRLLLPAMLPGDSVHIQYCGMFGDFVPTEISTATAQHFVSLLTQVNAKSHQLITVERCDFSDSVRDALIPSDYPVSPVPSDLIFISSLAVKPLLEDSLQASWIHDWAQSSDCRQTKEWFPEPHSKRTRALLRLPRETLGLVVQWITGHGWLRRHCNVLDASVDPRCRLCKDPSSPAPQVHSIFTPRSYVDRYYETPLHIWKHCPHADLALELPAAEADRSVSPCVWEVQPLVQFLSERTMLGLLSSPRA